MQIEYLLLEYGYGFEYTTGHWDFIKTGLTDPQYDFYYKKNWDLSANRLLQQHNHLLLLH
jgi:hypothetical protein